MLQSSRSRSNFRSAGPTFLGKINRHSRIFPRIVLWSPSPASPPLCGRGLRGNFLSLIAPWSDWLQISLSLFFFKIFFSLKSPLPRCERGGRQYVLGFPYLKVGGPSPLTPSSSSPATDKIYIFVSLGPISLKGPQMSNSAPPPH